MVPNEGGAPACGILLARGTNALTPRDFDPNPVLEPGLHHHGFPILTPWRPWVEVADRFLVLRARRIVWSRELALTSLVARPRVSPLGRMLLNHALPRLRPLVFFPVPVSWRP